MQALLEMVWYTRASSDWLEPFLSTLRSRHCCPLAELVVGKLIFHLQTALCLTVVQHKCCAVFLYPSIIFNYIPLVWSYSVFLLLIWNLNSFLFLLFISWGHSLFLFFTCVVSFSSFTAPTNPPKHFSYPLDGCFSCLATVFLPDHLHVFFPISFYTTTLCKCAFLVLLSAALWLASPVVLISSD